MQEQSICWFHQKIEQPKAARVSISEFIYPSENQSSRVWAALFRLKINGKYEFLASFLRGLMTSDATAQDTLLSNAVSFLDSVHISGSSVQIETEHSYAKNASINEIKKRRRADIFIKVDGQTFFIENKVRGAGWQDGQEQDYLYALKNGQGLLITISDYPADIEPVGQQIETPATQILRINCATHIQAWLHACKKLIRDNPTFLALTIEQIEDFQRSLPGGNSMDIENMNKLEPELWNADGLTILTILDDALKNSEYQDKLFGEFSNCFIQQLKNNLRDGLRVEVFEKQNATKKSGASIKIFRPGDSFALFVQFHNDQTVIGYGQPDGKRRDDKHPVPDFLSNTRYGRDDWYYEFKRLPYQAVIYNPTSLLGLYNCYQFTKNPAADRNQLMEAVQEFLDFRNDM